MFYNRTPTDDVMAAALFQVTRVYIDYDGRMRASPLVVACTGAQLFALWFRS